MEKPEIQIDTDLLKAGLSVQVVVARGKDGKVVDVIPWQTAVSRLIGSFLQELPKKWFGQDKRDERLAVSLQKAGLKEKQRYLSIGRKPWVWS